MPANPHSKFLKQLHGNLTCSAAAVVDPWEGQARRPSRSWHWPPGKLSPGAVKKDLLLYSHNGQGTG